MPPKAKGESKRGLVIAMVFMVLIMIGEGLGAYYGFSEQKKLTEAAKAAEDKVKVADEDRNWNRFQLAILLAYLDKAPDPNLPIGREMATNKAGFDAGTYPDPKSKLAAVETNKQELVTLKALVAKLNQRAA